MSWIVGKAARFGGAGSLAGRCAAAALAAVCALGAVSPRAAPPTGPAPALAAKAPAALPAPAATPTHALTAQDLERLARRPDADRAAHRADSRRRRRGGQGRPGAAREGLRLRRLQASRRRSIPKTTLFRPGSVSKLFTWTAVMQLVEQGKLDLDADVNTYLDFKIPPYQGKPVTLRELMTHRAGFSETARDLLTYGKAPPPLGEVLKPLRAAAHLRARRRPRLFELRREPRRLHRPARLRRAVRGLYPAPHLRIRSAWRARPSCSRCPPALVPHMATGYATWDKPGPGFEIVDMPPAGALSSTGDDMAHFMIAHLQHGRYGSGQILQPQTAQAMHTTIWRAFPDLNGNALGFYQQNINGHRVIAHGGDTDFFHTDLDLFLDDNVGLFISVNARGKEGMGEFLRDSLFTEFADRYFPAAAPPPAPHGGRRHRQGARGDDRRQLHHHAPLGLDLPVAGAADQLEHRGRQQGRHHHRHAARPAGAFVEVSPFLWRQFNGHDRIQATVSDGKVTRWGTDSSAPIWVFVRAGGLAGAGLELPLAIAAMGFLALTFVTWPGAAIARWRYGKPFPYAGGRAWVYRLARVAALLALAAVILWTVVLQLVSETTGAAVGGMLHLAQTISFLAFVGGTAIALANLWTVWRRKADWSARIFAVLLLAAFAFMLWIAAHYHLIGLSGEY